MTRSVESSEDTDSAKDTWSIIPDDPTDEESWQNQDSTLVRFLVALYYAMLANTDLLCYTFMIINHIYYACILSMPLPFFVFLWGMLSIPRPTKQFWITVITYVELVIVVKYVFQFQFPSAGNLNFNECQFYENVKTDESYPLCPPRIIGIERNRYSAVLDLVLLLVLFFHRFALKVNKRICHWIFLISQEIISGWKSCKLWMQFLNVAEIFHETFVSLELFFSQQFLSLKAILYFDMILYCRFSPCCWIQTQWKDSIFTINSNTLSNISSTLGIQSYGSNPS